MTTQLPPEVLTEIFSRLRVKILLRLRCVCKLFCYLIDSHDFVKYHLAKSLQNNTNLSLILTGGIEDEKVGIISFDFDSLDNRVVFETPLQSEFELGFCNGLLCLVDRRRNVVLLNTATRKHRVLPKRGGQLKSFSLCGFGYDTTNDDYKVISVHRSYYSECQLMVFSLKENVWMNVTEVCPYPLFIRKQHPFVSGKLHFFVSSNIIEADMMVGFDLSTEKFNELQMPDSLRSVKLFYLNMSMLGGCLCLVTNPMSGALHGDTWMMKEYGVKESWTKVFSVAPPVGGGCSFPVAYSGKKDRVLLRSFELCLNAKLHWYDLEDKKMEIIEKLDYSLPHFFFYARVMVESLEVVKKGKKQEDMRESVYDLSAMFDAVL